MQTFMIKVESSDDNSTAWFFVAANSEAEAREMVEDCTSHIVEFISDPAEIAATIKSEFDHVALIANI